MVFEAYLDFDHLKIDFRYATVRAGPVIWNIFPFGARDDAILRPAFCLVINPSTNDALILFHLTLQKPIFNKPDRQKIP